MIDKMVIKMIRMINDVADSNKDVDVSVGGDRTTPADFPLPILISLITSPPNPSNTYILNYHLYYLHNYYHLHYHLHYYLHYYPHNYYYSHYYHFYSHYYNFDNHYYDYGLIWHII